MKRYKESLLFSPTDLNGFVQCKHSTFLDLKDLENALPRAKEDEQSRLIKEKGIEHEQAYLEVLKKEYKKVVEIPSNLALKERISETAKAMQEGADVIYQAVLLSEPWHGFVDFLQRKDTALDQCRYNYEAIDTKLSRHPHPSHILQLCCYSELLEQAQGCRPLSFSLLLGDGKRENYHFNDYSQYYTTVKRNYVEYASSPPEVSHPEPCSFCSKCKWREICSKQWQDEDHLSLVANIRRDQRVKLELAGIKKVKDLVQLKENEPVAGIGSEALEQLRDQALLQMSKQKTGKSEVHILPSKEGKGFARLPRPDEGDLFFDMEGDPLYQDGLEYLFGFYYLEDGGPVFLPFWGHDRKGEKKAFQEVMDFLVQYLERYPQAYIYHYNHYEETALKRLASQHGRKEEELDSLLRGRKFVDLYKVVREAIRTSESGYSIKDLEVFYMEKRGGDGVATALDSIVVYEQWRHTKDDALLQKISDYNEDDCRSTYLLREWLLKLRPDNAQWFEVEENIQAQESRARQQEAEEERIALEEALLEGTGPEEMPLRELTAQLLEFHRREEKPKWWAVFSRQEKSVDELLDDTECLASLEEDPSNPSFQEKRSKVHNYTFPPQECKLRIGDPCCDVSTLEDIGSIFSLDVEKCTAGIKTTKSSLPQNLFLTGKPVFNTKSLKDAVRRFAVSLSNSESRYQALESFLRRDFPSIEGIEEGEEILSSGRTAVGVVTRLQESYLFIQGPPGAGKTYTSSQIIVELMRLGKRIGISSNSHKAINNLLEGVVKAAEKNDFQFRGQKKSNKDQDDSHFQGPMMQNFFKNTELDLSMNLIAGTAWLFAREEMDQALDYLFIDEAGQVSLANLIAMGMSAKNIILVGDQMQLAQPLQGTHPGDSGLSCLEYLLQGDSVISPKRGIFLGTSWRMHPRVCRFISEVVYNGKLQAEKSNAKQTLILNDHAHPVLKESGVHFLSVQHEGCSQKSEAEGKVVRELYESLLQQSFCSRDGKVSTFSHENILIVTPYNVQVNYLRSILPEEARVGTVDKFQGQEAEVVIVSMVTSGAEDLPRDIEFLYSKNRLNVALSRARILALVVASPALLEIPCTTVEQMRLVNSLCWVREYSAGF